MIPLLLCSPELTTCCFFFKMGYKIHQLPFKPTPLFQERSFGFSPSSPTSWPTSCHPLKTPPPNSVFSFSYPHLDLAPHSMVPLSWRVPLWCYFEPSLFFCRLRQDQLFRHNTQKRHPKTSDVFDLPNRKNKRQDRTTVQPQKNRWPGQKNNALIFQLPIYFGTCCSHFCQYIRYN